jgi:LCP family protein required for cell wall assembly
MTVNPHGLILPPELSPRGRPPRGGVAARFFKGVAATFAILVLMASITGYALYRKLNGNITRVCFLGDRGCIQVAGERPKKIGKSLNFLLIGADTRSSDPDEVEHFGGKDATSGLSDTTILLHLAAGQDKVTLISFPRDSWVEIPAHRNAKGDLVGATTAKLNSAFAKGGPTLTGATIEKLTGIYIDHYIQVDFTGFRRMVNALNGIDLCTPRPLRDRTSGLNLPAGRSHVLGDMALSYARARQFNKSGDTSGGLGVGDIGRIKRQQQLLGAMLRKARGSVFSTRFFDFLNVATKSLTFDRKLSSGAAKQLAMKMRNLDPGRVTFLTAPIVTDHGRRNGQSVVLLDEAKGKSLFDSIRNEGALPGASPGPTGPAVKLIVRPQNIRVNVLNGTGTKFRARTAADDLAKVGFIIRDITNADSEGYEHTIVRHGPDRADSAKTLAASVPGAQIQLDQSLGRTLELVVGKDYNGARPVMISSGRPTPTGSNAPPPPDSTAADDPCAGF